MKNLKLILSFALVLSVTLTGCFDDPGSDITWTGSYVEIAEATTAAGSDVVRALEQEADGVATPGTVSINLASAALTEPVTVTFTTSGTAIEGVHYNLLSGNTVTIPAGAFIGDIALEVLTFNIGTEEPVTLTIELTDVTGAELNPNYSTLNLTLQTLCTSAIPEGTYIEQCSGNTSVVTKIGSNTYRITQLNNCYYSGDYGDVFGEFSDVCEELTLLGVNNPDAFGIKWIGSGSFDAATNTITLSVADQEYNPDFFVDQTFVLQ